MMDTDAGHGEHGSTPHVSDATRADDRQLAGASARLPATAADISGERVEGDDDRPTVEHAAWLKQDDYWKRTTYIAMTGRHTATAPHTRPLPRPHRFRKPSPTRSALILFLTLALIVLIPLGVVVAQREGEAHIKLPTSIPGLTQPTVTNTAVPTLTPKPTATSKSKK